MPDHQAASNSSLPRIIFTTADDELKATPQGAAFFVKAMTERLGLTDIARELEMEKHHGLEMEHLMLLHLLFAAYGAKSISDLECSAQQDASLGAVIGEVRRIHHKTVRYFAARHEEATLAQLLDSTVRHAQQEKRFASREDGVLALDDSTIEKFGRKMDNIAVVFDHCEKRFHLGYVLVSTCYCDSTKAYPVNFAFRFPTEEEKRRDEEERLKKERGIDFRTRDAVGQWLKALAEEERLPPVVVLRGPQQAHSDNLSVVDQFELPWVAIVHGRMRIFDTQGEKQWDLDALRRKTLGNKPDFLEVEGLCIYTKGVSLRGYDGEVDFVLLTDVAGNERASVLVPRASYKERNIWILDYLAVERGPEASKLHLGIDLIRRAKEKAQIRASTVAVDAWYFVVWFVQAALQIGGIMQLVSKLKCDQMVCYRGQWMQAHLLWRLKTLTFRHQRKEGFKWASLLVYIEGLGEVRLVLVQELDKEKPWRVLAHYVLVCTNPKASPLKIVAWYKLRWGIEVFYRTAKQRFGLTQFHARKFTAIYFHMTFVFLAYLMTAVLKQVTPSLLARTMGEIIDRYLCCLVRLKRKAGQIIILLDPRFVQEFGIPLGQSP